MAKSADRSLDKRKKGRSHKTEKSAKKHQETPKQADVKPTIPKALEGFVCEVDALADTLPLMVPLIASSLGATAKNFKDFLEQRCSKIDGKSFTVPPEEYTEFFNLQRRLQRSRRAMQIIPRSFLTSLVSHFDAFIGSLIRAIFYMKPEVLNSSGGD